MILRFLDIMHHQLSYIGIISYYNIVILDTNYYSDNIYNNCSITCIINREHTCTILLYINKINVTVLQQYAWNHKSLLLQVFCGNRKPKGL